MTLKAEEKKSLSDYRLKKAERLLEDAALLLREGRYESSVNRSYYAALSAAKAVLILFGSDPKTHEGVKTLVGQKLVVGGYIETNYGKWFRSLLFEREDADYADFVIKDRADAQEAYEHAEVFIKKMSEVAGAVSKELTG